MNQQAKNFTMWVEESGLKAQLVLRDQDQKFQDGFDSVIKGSGIKPVVLTRASPNLNAYAERAVQTVKHECLDHFVILGERHVNHLVGEFVEFYNECRPHWGCGSLPPKQPRSHSPPSEGRIVCEQRLGGLLKHYYREAA